MTEFDVSSKIVNTFSTAYNVSDVEVVRKAYGFDCIFKLNGDFERGIYSCGWFKWQSNGNIRLRLNRAL